MLGKPEENKNITQQLTAELEALVVNVFYLSLRLLKKGEGGGKKPNNIVRMYLQQTFLGLVPQLSWL